MIKVDEFMGFPGSDNLIMMFFYQFYFTILSYFVCIALRDFGDKRFISNVFIIIII